MSHQLSDPRLPCRRDLCRKRSYNFMMTESPAWPCGTLAMLLLGEPRLLVVRGPLRPGFLGSSASEVLGCRQQVFRLWWLTATTISRRVRPPQHELRQSTQSKTWGGDDVMLRIAMMSACQRRIDCRAVVLQAWRPVIRSSSLTPSETQGGNPGQGRSGPGPGGLSVQESHWPAVKSRGLVRYT